MSWGWLRFGRPRPVPLAVDDAAADPALLQHAIDRGAADVLVLKPSCLGGLTATAVAAKGARARWDASGP